MSDNMPKITIAPMSREFLLWRCLHDGPLGADSLDAPTHPGIDWPALRRRNRALLARLCEAYGSCAMLAWHDGKVVGMLRFYPKAICEMADAGQMCLQQAPPNGPANQLVELDWPGMDELDDRALVVHCLMTGSPKAESNPFQRRGLGTRLVRALEDWARGRGWDAIVASAYADLPIVYEITGQAGLSFWRKLGYEIIGTAPVPELARAIKETAGEGGLDGYLRVLVEQATAVDMSPDEAIQQFTLRKSL